MLGDFWPGVADIIFSELQFRIAHAILILYGAKAA